MTMTRGWEVLLSDGSIIQESQMEWRKVPKSLITRLSLIFDERRWDLSDKSAYFVQNRASMCPGSSNSLRIEQRSIGYYEGADKVFYTVNELTGTFNMYIESNRN